MSVRPWYKRYPSDAIAGMMMLTAEEKGVYNTLLDLMYDRGGSIENSPTDLARICGCSTRRFNQLCERLCEHHQKITLENGLIMNGRVKKQLLSEEKEHRKLRENGLKGAEKTNEKRADNNKNNELDEKGPLKKSRPNPEARSQSRDGSKEPSARAKEFHDVFWPAYPHKVAKPKALTAFEKARQKISLEAIISGLERYKHSKPREQAWAHPTTWLNEERWSDQPCLDNWSKHDKPDRTAEAADRIRDDLRRGQAARSEGHTPGTAP